MYDLLLAILWFMLIMLGSLLITYYSVLIMSEKENNLEVVIMLQLSLFITALVDCMADITSLATATALGIISFSRLKTYSLIAIVGIILYTVPESSLLETGDTCWRCIVNPLVRNVGFTVLHIGRLVYDSVIPLYNYFVVVSGQATRGTIGTAINCDLSMVVSTIRYILQAFIALFTSIFDWVGVGEMSVDNNIMVNELNITTLVDRLQLVVSSQESTAVCVCSELKEIFSIVFAFAQQKELPIAVTHAVNIPLSVVQTFVNALPVFKKYPHFTKTVYHTNGFIFHGMKYFDQVILNAGEKTIRLFIDDFQLQGAPEEFFFTSLGRFAMAFVHAVHTVVRSVINIIIPVYIKDSDYMMRAMRFDRAFIELTHGIHTLANNIEWFITVCVTFVDEIERAAISGRKVNIIGIPKHVQLNCTLTNNTVCGALLAAEAVSNTAYIGLSLVSEITWKSIFNQEQNLLRTMQRYDGPSYPRHIIPTCEYRESITWDLTSGECKCKRPLDYGALVIKDNPYGEVEYDPFCGQPNLQANVFGNIERAIGQAVSVGGQLPDALNDLLVVAPAIGIELIRTLVKIVFSLEDIGNGRFFNWPVNCGYGVSEARLEQWWLGENYTIEVCNNPSYMKVDGKCTPIHDHIIANMCGIRANTGLELCTIFNHEGCTCNVALELDDSSLCQCLYDFPDREQEIAQGAFSNKVLNALYDHSNHWCNTYLFEWNFYYLDRIALIFDSVIGSFHPSYSTDSGYCTSKAYDLVTTDILRYTPYSPIYDALNIENKNCKVYGSHDFICSASLTVRSGVRLVISEMRELIMTMLNVFGGRVSIMIDFANRLCDLQRTAAGIASLIASIFEGFDVSESIRIGIARVLFSIMDLPIQMINMVNSLIGFLPRITGGAIERNVGRGSVAQNILQPAFDLIVVELKIMINWLRSFLVSLEVLFNSIHEKAGGFFNTLVQIVDIINQLLSDAALEMVGLFAKVGAEIINFFTSGTISDGFFRDLWSLITKGVGMLLQNAGKILEVILEMLGPVGKFIRDLATSICYPIQDTLCFLTGGDLCDLKCAGSSRRRLLSSEHIPKVVADMGWDGTSHCDMFINAYRNYTFEEMRPFEQITLAECVEDRAFAVRLAKNTGLDIPIDLIYNWKRKWVLARDTVVSGRLYMHYLAGQLTVGELRHNMHRDHVNPLLFIPLFSKLTTFGKQLFSFTNINDLVHSSFKAFDPNIKYSPSTMGNIYRLYEHTSHAAYKILNTTMKANVGHQLQRLNYVAPLKLRSRHRHIEQFVFSTSHTRAREIVFNVAGINTNATPCSTGVCLNCVALENIVNTIINEGERMADYYEKKYFPIVLPSFVDYFEDQEENRAWREDMGLIMDDVTFQSTLREAPWDQARKDWEELFTNFNTDKDFSLFLTVTDDSYVPFFGRSFTWFVTYPFVGTCPMETIYCSTHTTKQRLNFIDDALRYNMYLTLVLVGFQWYTGLPILTMVVSYLPLLWVSVFMITVYDYKYTCIPNLPNCLVDDLFAYLNDRAPNCWCTYFSGLAETCDPQTCFLCSATTEYAQCDKPFLWAPAFYIGYHYPTLYMNAYQNIPFSWILRRFDVTVDIARVLLENESFSNADLNCLTIHFKDIILLFLLAYVAIFFVSVVLPIGVRGVQYTIKLLMMFITTIHTMAVSIELSTVE